MFWLIAVALSAPLHLIQDEPERPEDALDVDLPQGSSPAPIGVVGGDDVVDGDWPDAAAMLQGSEGRFECGGVLVAPDLVLTAAHCDFNLSEVVVDTTRWATDGERLSVLQTTSYAQPFQTYDVAVVQLATPSAVLPRAIATDCILEDWLEPEAPGVVVGWGAINTDASGFPDWLQQVELPIYDPECSDSHAGCNAAVMPAGELIAGGDGQDSCSGDSGGPLYLRTPVGDYLLGLTSRGASPATQPCGDGGIYVRVDAVADWVEQVSGVRLTRPDCSAINRRPRPSAPPLLIIGDQGSVVIDPGDPDAGDSHRFELAAGPEHGAASIDQDGILSWSRLAPYVGTDAVVVAVTDDGTPPLSRTVTVSLAILPPGLDSGVRENRRGCGCGTTGTGAWLPLLLLAVLRRRRR